MKIHTAICSLYITLLASSCAGMYRSTPMDRYVFDNHQVNRKDSIWYSYVPNVMRKNRCIKYTNHERRERVTMVVVKIENRGKKPLDLSLGNLKVSVNDQPISIISASTYVRTVKQKPGFYLFWALPFYTAPIGFFNWIIAASANSKLRKDVARNSLENNYIPAKQSITGYLFLYSPPVQDLKLEVIRDGDQ